MVAYLTPNFSNGTQFMGQTRQTLKKRWGQHVGEATRPKGSERPLTANAQHRRKVA